MSDIDTGTQLMNAHGLQDALGAKLNKRFNMAIAAIIQAYTSNDDIRESFWIGKAAELALCRAIAREMNVELKAAIHRFEADIKL